MHYGNRFEVENLFSRLRARNKKVLTEEFLLLRSPIVRRDPLTDCKTIAVSRSGKGDNRILHPASENIRLEGRLRNFKLSIRI